MPEYENLMVSSKNILSKKTIKRLLVGIENNK